MLVGDHKEGIADTSVLGVMHFTLNLTNFNAHFSIPYCVSSIKSSKFRKFIGKY